MVGTTVGARRRMVGPFIFIDQLGPVALPPDREITVLPHPHIGLSTITYRRRDCGLSPRHGGLAARRCGHSCSAANRSGDPATSCGTSSPARKSVEREQLRVVGEPHGHRALEGQDPLPKRDGWNADDQRYELAVVNRLFGEKTVAFESEYLDLTRAAFGAPLEPTDFAGSPDAARRRINGWVEQQTHDRIKDLMPPGAVTPATRLVLVNAVYFKAAWQDPFSESATRDQTFNAPTGAKKVPMMRKVGHYAHKRVPEAALAVIHLPYEGDGIEMVIVLPDDPKGLAAVEKAMSAEVLASWLEVGNWPRVDLQLPKFKIEMPDPLRLSGILKAMGIERAFDHTLADFTKMAPADAQLEISEAFHKAFIEVDEKGTEAAAATALGMRGGAAAPTDEPIPFVADHPFLYLIRDTKTDAILFMGRVVDPSAGS
jgi:serpin B